MQISDQNVAVFGASGAIGSEFVRQLIRRNDTKRIFAFSRSKMYFDDLKVKELNCDLTSESSILVAAEKVAQDYPLDKIIITTGILHEEGLMPEKALKDLSIEKFQRLFAVNTIGPALIAKHFLSKLNRTRPSIFAALSARVGSTSDNHLGGWYAYRASKAALNMILKTVSIEIARQNKQAIVVALHPGTVDSRLSKPFQRNVSKQKLFSPEDAVSKMLKVLDNLSNEDSGKFFAWDGNTIPF